MLLVPKQHRCSSCRGSDLLKLWISLCLKALGFKALCRVSTGLGITQGQTGPGSTGNVQVNNKKRFIRKYQDYYFSMLRKKKKKPANFYISNSANQCGFTIYGCRKKTCLLTNFNFSLLVKGTPTKRELTSGTAQHQPVSVTAGQGHTPGEDQGSISHDSNRWH